MKKNLQKDIYYVQCVVDMTFEMDLQWLSEKNVFEKVYCWYYSLSKYQKHSVEPKRTGQNGNTCSYWIQHEWSIKRSIWLICYCWVILKMVQKSSEWLNIGIFVWVLLKNGNGIIGVIWKWIWWEVVFFLRCRLFKFVWINIKIWIVLIGFCGNLQWYTNTWAESRTIWSEFSVASVGGVLSVVSILFMFWFEITGVVCVWDWKPAVLLCFVSWAGVFSVMLHWFEPISLMWGLIGLFAVIAPVIVIC